MSQENQGEFTNSLPSLSEMPAHKSMCAYAKHIQLSCACFVPSAKHWHVQAMVVNLNAHPQQQNVAIPAMYTWAYYDGICVYGEETGVAAPNKMDCRWMYSIGQLAWTSRLVVHFYAKRSCRSKLFLPSRAGFPKIAPGCR